MTRRAIPHEILANAWRANPHTYAQKVSRGSWLPYRWIVEASRIVTPLILKGNARIIINAPVRVGKSEFFSCWVPIWWADLFPERHTMITSYSGELAEDFGRKIRNELAGNDLCMTKLREDSKAANRWHTQEGGGLVAAGVGGALPGRGYDLGIIDDATKEQDVAASWSYQQKINHWYQSVFLLRAEPGASIVVVMTRLDEGDLCGFLIEENDEEWTVLSMPALAHKGDVLGRQEGEAICPERRSVEELLRIRRAAGPRVWDAMFDQNPKSAGKGLAYKEFRQAGNIDQSLVLDRRRPLDISFDFNINPGMHVILGQEDTRRDLITAVHEIHEPRMNVREAVAALDRLVKELGGWRQWHMVRIFGDATGETGNVVTSESCYQSVFELLSKRKVKSVRCVPASNPPVRSSLDAFNDALRDCEGQVHYKVHPRCERLVYDMKKVKTDKQGLIDKADQTISHSSDAERYRISWLRPVGIAVASGTGGKFNVHGVAGRIGAA